MTRNFRIRDAVADVVEMFLIGTTVFILVYILVGQFLTVSGTSMEPYLLNEEHMIVEKLSIKFNPLERGDVIVFWHPLEKGSLLVKRIVGMPGERIKIQNGHVYINGSVLEESYINKRVATTQHEFLKEGVDYTIPKDSYMVLGDNRPESGDSRDWGAVKKDTVIGRALLVFYPFNNIRLLEKLGK